jgi:hypothetical protein
MQPPTEHGYRSLSLHPSSVLPYGRACGSLPVQGEAEGDPFGILRD